MSAWTTVEVSFLRLNYPTKGRAWCAQAMNKTDAQIRAKASRLGLRARGVSEAWQEKQKRHAEALTGRKRPEQAKVMLALHDAGKLKKSPTQREAIGARVRTWLAENGAPEGRAWHETHAGNQERDS